MARNYTELSEPMWHEEWIDRFRSYGMPETLFCICSDMIYRLGVMGYYHSLSNRYFINDEGVHLFYGGGADVEIGVIIPWIDDSDSWFTVYREVLRIGDLSLKDLESQEKKRDLQHMI